MPNWKSGPNSPIGQLTPGGSEQPKYPIYGQIGKFYDDLLGEAEFIFLPGVAGTTIGAVVNYDLNPAGRSTALHATGVATNSGRNVAVATAANLLGFSSWYQISGVALVNAVAATVAGPIFASATPGSITSVADAGDQILGGRILTPVGTPEAGRCYVQLNRPFAQGQIT